MDPSDKILKRLLSLHPKLIDLELGRIERLLGALGNPHENLGPVIHIAGTNGKGSTLAFIQAMLQSAGYRVNAYTSPHLIHFHERITLSGAHISEDQLSSALETCEAANGGKPITFFEITTAAAFLAFSQNPADFTLLETGLGGRFDATNVIDRPALSLITPIAIDHQEFLGGELTKIAAEKAGIIKKDTPCITGPQDAAVLKILEERSWGLGAPLIVHGRDWQVFEQHGRLVYQDDNGLLDLPLPVLAGQHQIDNAGLAIAALRALKPDNFQEIHIEKGLQNASWPGRLQKLANYGNAELWLDGGHNPAAGKVLANAMAALEERNPRPLIIILGMMAAKDAAGFIAPFKGLASKIITLNIPGEKNAAGAKELKMTARKAGFQAQAAASLEQALKYAAQPDSPPPRILITGSLYLAGHVLRHGI